MICLVALFDFIQGFGERLPGQQNALLAGRMLAQRAERCEVFVRGRCIIAVASTGSGLTIDIAVRNICEM
jgi:hypothetical protein